MNHLFFTGAEISKNLKNFMKRHLHRKQQKKSYQQPIEGEQEDESLKQEEKTNQVEPEKKDNSNKDLEGKIKYL